MNNKSVLAVVTAQTAVIIGLLYLIWNQKSNELILNSRLKKFNKIDLRIKNKIITSYE